MFKKQDKAEYTDFNNLIKKIKEMIKQNFNYEISYKKIDEFSRQIILKNEDHTMDFSIHFINFDVKNNLAKLKIQFKNNNYEIFYVNKNYLVKIGNLIMDLYSNFIECLLKKEYESNVQDKIFPETFELEYINDIATFPVKTPFCCPVCNGNLCINDDKQIKTEEYKALNSEIRQYDKYNYEPECLCYSFAGYLTCNLCDEKIAGLGYSVYSEPIAMENSKYFTQTFYIKYFERVNDFIKIDSLQNSELKEILRQSFKLYFCDKESCANKIRVFIEKFLTEIGVNETTTNGTLISLNKRIQNCKKFSKPQKETLAVLKNIGNIGSHSNNSISNEDLYKTYKVLEDIIAEYHHEEHVSDLKNDLKQHFSR